VLGFWGVVCFLEQEMFNEIVTKLVEEFGLDSLSDKILVQRVAMYLIRIMRYDAAVEDMLARHMLSLNEKRGAW
jgi:hypothetical protein